MFGGRSVSDRVVAARHLECKAAAMHSRLGVFVFRFLQCVDFCWIDMEIFDSLYRGHMYLRKHLLGGWRDWWTI